MRQVKQSTAQNIFIVMISSSDYYTPLAGLSLTMTINLCKNDENSYTPITPTITDLSDGVYILSLTVSHTDTLGDMVLKISSPGAVTQFIFLNVTDIYSRLSTIPDEVLTRDFSAIDDSLMEKRTALNSLRKLINKVSLSGSTVTIYKEDDSTSAFTQTVSTDGTAKPIVGVDTVG